MPEHSSAIRPAVAIPVYKSELSAAEKISVDRVVEVLAGRPLFLVGPVRLSADLETLRRRYGQRLQVKTFGDRYFSGIKGYNALMRSTELYRSFADHSHLLVAQTDALVISDRLDWWCGQDFSYIGAPWFVGGSDPSLPLKFMGVGNGGFSLRRIADALRVLDTRRHIPNFIKSTARGHRGFVNLVRRVKHERILAYNFEPFFPSSNEDFFWGMLVPAACPFFRVPKPEDAIDFAFDAEPRHLFAMNGNRLPFGCHAWERYDRRFWEEQLPFLPAAA